MEHSRTLSISPNAPKPGKRNDELRISILLPDLRAGGAERVQIDLAQEFVRMGHRVEFVLMRAEGELLEEAQEAFPVVDLGVARVRGLLLPLIRYLRRVRPDALMAAMWPATVIAPFAAKLARVGARVLVSEHASLAGQYRHKGSFHWHTMRGSMALGYRMAETRVGVSDGVVDELSRLTGMAPNHFARVYNPVVGSRSRTVEASEAVEALWQPQSTPRLLTVGRLKAVKNHSLLLRAFTLLSRQDAQLMFVGEGECEGELRTLAKQLGVANRVIFAGFHPDPGPFYRSADVFVLSSDYEGFGNVIVEALAAGTPVVCTDCPYGPSEILAGGAYGTLVPVGDAEALARGIEVALDATRDPELLRTRAAEFSPEAAAESYLKLVS